VQPQDARKRIRPFVLALPSRFGSFWLRFNQKQKLINFVPRIPDLSLHGVCCE